MTDEAEWKRRAIAAERAVIEMAKEDLCLRGSASLPSGPNWRAEYVKLLEVVDAHPDGAALRLMAGKPERVGPSGSLRDAAPSKLAFAAAWEAYRTAYQGNTREPESMERGLRAALGAAYEIDRVVEPPAEVARLTVLMDSVGLENKRLFEEVARLRAALQDFVDHGPSDSVLVSRARAALGPSEPPGKVAP